jgi:hypothetical protein
MHALMRAQRARISIGSGMFALKSDVQENVLTGVVPRCDERPQKGCGLLERTIALYIAATSLQVAAS